MLVVVKQDIQHPASGFHTSMLFTVLMPQARAADRHRAALSITRAGSKFRGTTLTVARPMLNVVARPPLSLWR
jgi:hypothetical protein